MKRSFYLFLILLSGNLFSWWSIERSPYYKGPWDPKRPWYSYYADENLQTHPYNLVFHSRDHFRTATDNQFSIQSRVREVATNSAMDYQPRDKRMHSFSIINNGPNDLVCAMSDAHDAVDSALQQQWQKACCDGKSANDYKKIIQFFRSHSVIRTAFDKQFIDIIHELDTVINCPTLENVIAMQRLAIAIGSAKSGWFNNYINERIHLFINYLTRRLLTVKNNHVIVKPIESYNTQEIIDNQFATLIDMHCPEYKQNILRCRNLSSGLINGCIAILDEKIFYRKDLTQHPHFKHLMELHQLVAMGDYEKAVQQAHQGCSDEQLFLKALEQRYPCFAVQQSVKNQFIEPNNEHQDAHLVGADSSAANQMDRLAGSSAEKATEERLYRFSDSAMQELLQKIRQLDTDCRLSSQDFAFLIEALDEADFFVCAMNCANLDNYIEKTKLVLKHFVSRLNPVTQYQNLKDMAVMVVNWETLCAATRFIIIASKVIPDRQFLMQKVCDYYWSGRNEIIAEKISHFFRSISWSMLGQIKLESFIHFLASLAGDIVFFNYFGRALTALKAIKAIVTDYKAIETVVAQIGEVGEAIEICNSAIIEGAREVGKLEETAQMVKALATEEKGIITLSQPKPQSSLSPPKELLRSSEILVDNSVAVPRIELPFRFPVTRESAELIERITPIIEATRPEIAQIEQLYTQTRKGFGEFAHKWVKLGPEHLLVPELEVTKEGIVRFSGFHHDFMGIIEESGIIQLTNKVVDQFGCYRADVWFNGKSVPKSFFPKEWPREKAIAKVFEAYDQFIATGATNFEISPGGKYKLVGYTTEGIKIENIITKKGHVCTAYPFVKG